MEPIELTAFVVLAWQLAGPERTGLLEACTRALPVGVCVEVDEDAAPEGRGGLVARIERAGEHEVSVWVRGSASGDPLRQKLRFLPADTELERAKAVGLTVGVLAGELARREELALEAPSEPGTLPGEGPTREPWQRLLLSGQVGAGWDSGLGVSEFGAALRGGWRPRDRSWLLGFAVDNWWVRPPTRELRVQKSHGVLWAGWSEPVGSGPVELGAWVDFGMQWLRATTASPLPSDRSGRVTAVGRVSGATTYWADRLWGVQLTAQATWHISPTVLHVQAEPLAHTGRAHLAVLLGPVLRWEP